jgi:hypothetical protein
LKFLRDSFLVTKKEKLHKKHIVNGIDSPISQNGAIWLTWIG